MNSYYYERVSSLDQIGDLRKKYLDHIPQPQELFIEYKIKVGKVFSIRIDSEQIGYFLLSEDNVLLEYFVVDKVLNNIDEVFSSVVESFSIKTAYCKSFDQKFLSCCAGIQKRMTVLGIHFRELNKHVMNQDDSNISSRLANVNDFAIIKEINDDFFDNDDEINLVINNANMFIFEKENDLIGCGIFQRVIDGRPDFDIGMLVNKTFRRKGYGSYIIDFLVEHCRENNWRPICGCAYDNTGSRRTLEKVGFVAGYRLLEFTF